jgi:predicted O-linked N-acetylglucosamine transferase (SPINDLY family)
LQPNFPEALNNLGYTLTDLGRMDEATEVLGRALALRPDFSSAAYNLGIALHRRGMIEAAISAYQRAIALSPNHAEAYNNLGIVLTETGRFDEAIVAIRRALQLRSDYAQAHHHLGLALAGSGRHGEAVAAYRQAIHFAPDFAEAYNSLAVTLEELGELDDAAAALQRALQLKPDYPEAYNNLGNVRCHQGRPEEAASSFRRTLQLDPASAVARSNLIRTLHFLPGDVRQEIREEQERWNQQFGDSMKGNVHRHANSRNAERPLCIGYVSPDFRDHVIGRNILPLFRSHDHRQFKIVAYSGVIRPDSLTQQFRELAHEWRSTVGVSDEALAARIRQDEVDILVDLTQHLSGNRLPVFAHRPAPVQVSFAGYPESPGVDAVGYRISDRWMESDPGSGVFLIDSFWCYDPCGMEIAPNESPALRNGYITFGSLNHFLKVNDPVLKLWAEILGAVANSRLILLSYPGSHRQHSLEIFSREGIDPQRIEFLAPCSRKNYLELYHPLDVMLDPFPYNGHTTSLDALWMGVLVVSLVGERAVSRAGWSQLSNLGLADLAAFSEKDYVRMAIQLAGDISRLNEWRATLRSRMEASVLMNATHFARQIEAGYRAMWREWSGKNPT